MDKTPKYTNAQKFGWAQTIVIVMVVGCVIGLVLILNAILPPGW